MCARSVTQFLESLVLKTLGFPSFIRIMDFKIVLKWLCSRSGGYVCDVACGRGGLSYKLSKRGYKVVGLDISGDRMRRNKKIFATAKNLDFVIANAEFLPFRDCVFDKIVCNSSLEHFSNDVKALEEMNRVLKVGCSAILTVDSLSYPKANREFIERYKDKHIYTTETLTRKLELTGFEVIREKYYINSRISYFFFRLSAMNKVFLVLTTLFYPVCLLSDKLFGVNTGGMCLAIEAKKRLEFDTSRS